MKVSVLCIYYHLNYGSVLQSLALNNYLEKKGHNVNIIPKCEFNGIKEKLKIFFHLRLAKLLDPSIVSRKLKERKSSNVIANSDSEYLDGLKQRNKAYDRFIKKYFKVSNERIDRKALKFFVSDSDAVIVGSDQLWTPHEIITGFHTLEFVPDGIKRISYATSFGVSNLPNNYLKNKTKNFIKKMDFVSVREIQGKEIIDDLNIDKDVKVVVDPTMLLSRMEWDEMIDSQRIVDEPYIFCYFLGNNPEQRKLAVKVSERTGFKIVALQHMDEYIATDKDYADKVLYDIDPGQFVSLIRDAEIIFTDSFHGTVFSVLYHRLFYVMNRHKANEVRSTNSRIETLCSILGLEDRHIENVEKVDVDDLLLKKIEFQEVDKKLEERRKFSETYINNALQG